MRPCAAAALAAMLSVPARAETTMQLRFDCKLGTSPAPAAQASPAWGSAFTASIAFGEGESLALLDPETKAPQGTVHGADVLAGQFAAGSETATLLWTRAHSSRGALVGLAIRPDGHVVTLVLERSAGGRDNRRVSVLDSASSKAWPGVCVAHQPRGGDLP